MVSLLFPCIFLLKDGSVGVLEGLASRYADQFTTHYQDVLDHLGQLRTEALATRPPPAVGGHEANAGPDAEATSAGMLGFLATRRNIS